MLKSRLQELYQTNKKMFISIIALLEAILIISVATFSWIEGTKDGSVKDTSSTVSAGAGLIFKTIDGSVLTNLELPVINLEDCSSVDGRNFYFPTTESTGSSNSTFFFRAGTDADINTKYISQDFNVEALATSKIYIDGSSYVKCDSNPEILNAIRISLNFNDGSAPVVFCPALTSAGYTHTNAAVSSISATGTVTATATTSSISFKNFDFSTENPILEINGGETKRITFSMWLEGTDDSCTLSNIPSESIEVNLILSTTENPTRDITFVDYTPNRWVSDLSAGGNDVFMFVVDKSTIKNNDPTTGDRYLMEKTSDNKFVAHIPMNINDVMFARFDPDNQSTSYNYWANTSNVTRGSKTTYYAISRGKDVEGVDIGYWVDDSCTGVIDVYLTDGNNTFSVTDEIMFTNNLGWSNIKAYFFNKNTDTAVGAAYPGTAMTYSYTNDQSQDIYKIQIPNGATSVVFNGSGGQTVDITLGSHGGYWLDGSQTDGKYNATGWGTRSSATNPNVYFTSATYGTAITNAGCGHCKPTSAYNSSTNYGLVTEFAGTNSSNQNVYHIILPADAIIKFNGNNSTWDVTPTGIDKTVYQKIGYWYSSASSNDTWIPGDDWPRV